jgi:tetratricopeptide (TPR) repeat protein
MGLDGTRDGGSWERRIACLEAATAAMPSSARLHALLGEAHLRCYEERRAEHAEETSRLAQAHLLPGLRQYIAARDLCPLAARPHLRIAAHREWLARADARTDYLDRAASLVPWDPELWYLRGVQEVADGRQEQACRSWHRCLELSDQYLEPILDRSRAVFEPAVIASEVVPADPRVLLAAAVYLVPAPDAVAERRPFLDRALALLAEQAGPVKAQDLHLKARIHDELGQPSQALAAYAEALDRNPFQLTWRCEMAGLLARQGRLHDAEREVRVVLHAQPDNKEARAVLDTVLRGLTDER